MVQMKEIIQSEERLDQPTCDGADDAHGEFEGTRQLKTRRGNDVRSIAEAMATARLLQR